MKHDRHYVARGLVATVAALGVSAGVMVESSGSPRPNTASSVANNTIAIDLDVLPNKLPPIIAALALRSVRVERQGYYGSGTMIGDNEIITAGHVLLDKGAQPDSKPYACDRYRANYQARAIAASPGIAYDNLSSKVQRAVGQSSSHDELADIGLLRMPAAMPLTRISLRSTALKPDEVVFFTTEQPHKGIDRQLSTSDDPQRAGPWAAPAIYGGVVLAEYPDGTAAIATGLKSYGELDDVRIVPGGSGGGVWDASGQLVGEPVVAYPMDALGHTTPVAAETVAGRYHVRFADNSKATKIVVALVKLTTPEVVDELEARLDAAPDCYGKWPNKLTPNY